MFFKEYYPKIKVRERETCVKRLIFSVWRANGGNIFIVKKIQQKPLLNSLEKKL